MLSIKQMASDIKWRHAVYKVDKAISVFANTGLGYSRTDGIIGDLSKYGEREVKKINAAAEVMSKFRAGYYPKKEKFTKTTEINPVRYTPLKYAYHEDNQIKAYQQAATSMHLRAGLKMIQRVNFDPRLQAHPNRRLLGITPEDAQEWAANVESLWRDDKESKEWDESLQNNYAQLSDMALWGYESIGEFFCIRRPYFDDEKRVTNISLQLISPFQVRTPFFYGYIPVKFYDYTSNCIVAIPAGDYLGRLENGNYIESGIEYNKKNQEVAIYLYLGDDGYGYMRIPVYSPSGFQQVLHGFIQSEPGQKRGVAESVTSYHEFLNIRDLCQFELESAKINSTIAGTVTADSNAQPGGKEPMNDAGWQNLDDENPTSLEQDPAYSVRKVKNGGYIVQGFTPGYKYTEIDTKRPNQNIPLYIEKLLEYIYPSIIGMSVVTVRQRFDGSYNASKGSIDLSWKNGIEYTLKQFSSDWHRPNYEAWLNGKIATGEVAAPGWGDMRKRRAWSSMSIIIPPKPSLNPLQEAKAATEKLSIGVSNRELESQQLTGTSAEENAERLLPENKKLALANRELSAFDNPETGGQDAE